MDGTQWGYIHQKKKTAEAESDAHQLRVENERLKKMVETLLAKQSLSKEDREFLERI